MRVAIIGSGSIGTRHAQNLIALGHRPVLYDADDTQLVRCSTALRGYAEYERLRKWYRLDAAIICTPAPTHLEYLLTCLERRIPVLVEKPLGVLSDLPVLRIVRPTVPVMVAYNWRFHGETMSWLRRHKGQRVYFGCDTNMALWPGKDYDDPLLECSHEIDLALMRGGHFNRYASGVAPAWAAIDFEGESGASVRLQWRASEVKRELWCVDAKGERRGIGLSLGASLDKSYLDELAHFLRAVEGGPIAPGCTLEEGIAVLDVIQQAERMAA